MRTIPEPVVRPPRLRAGSRVALISPAGPIDDARIAGAFRICDELGLIPVTGDAALLRTGYLAGSDMARAADLQKAIDDPAIDAIWALRGGYGTVRLLPHVTLDRMRTRPKVYVGFSDNTSIHLALARLGIVSFHAPHAGGDFPPFAEQSFKRILFDASLDIAAPPESPLISWKDGIAEGRLVGGNLALLAAAEGTPYSAPTDSCILFIEDIGEPPYRIDRLLMQLQLSGALDNVVGIIVGQFTDCDDGGVTALDVVRGALDPLDIPVVANAPIGHVALNWTLPVGIRARVDGNSANIALLEPAVC